MASHNSTKFAFWNARGLRHKINETLNFAKEHDIDIMAISETKLNENVNLRSDPTYKIERLDRNSQHPGGGVAFLIKRNLKYELLPLINTKIIEALTIKIHADARPYIVTAIYYPGLQDAVSLQNFKEDLSKLTASTLPFILMGDFNARHSHWNCIRANPSGKLLFDFLMTHPVFIHYPFDPTFYPEDTTKNPSTLDFLITDGRLPLSQPETSTSLSCSDHVPVTLTLDFSSSFFPEGLCVKDYAAADWKRFRSILNDEIDLQNVTSESLVTAEDIDSAIENLTAKILSAENQTVPNKRVSPRSFQLNDGTKSLISIRNSFRRRSQRNRDIANRDEIKNLNELIQEKIKAQINMEFQHTMSGISENDPLHEKMWRICKNLKRRNTNIPVLMHQGSRVVTNKDKADLLKEEILKAHSLTHKETCQTAHEKSIRRDFRKLNREVPEIPITGFISVKEIRSFIAKLKNRKASGPDGMGNRCIKHLSNKALVQLSYIFNACLRISYFPEQWKLATVLAFRKPGKDPRQPGNYRPISLLCPLSKIFEKCILSRINDFVEENNILKDEQFGFRKHHSCVR